MNSLEISKPPIVLVVEDESLVRLLASDILTEEGGYRVLEARNVNEALEILELRPDVQVVFTDVNMPGSLNGYALARITAMRWPSIGVLITSGKANPGPGDVPKNGQFIDKPYAPSTLLAAVQGLLSKTSERVIDQHTLTGRPIAFGPPVKH